MYNWGMSAAKSASFTCDLKQLSGGAVALSLGGVIDESAAFPPLTGARSAEISFEHVKYISSFGIKTWIKWIKMQTNIERWSFKHVQVPIVITIATVAGFMPTGTVIESFYAPFTSDETLESVTLLLVRGKDFGNGIKLTLPSPNDSKGNRMVPDFSPTRYLAFLGKDV